jgi:pimeloyl-ACP methyl ester carboxylesterase
MTTSTTGALDVPGATLYYEVRGAGPLLLLIAGGGGDAGMYGGLFAELAARHTVLTYDPRPFSRSRLHGPVGGQRVGEWAEDALRLLDHVAPEESAAVAGCSSGAIVALDLLARHPDRLTRVVAHEPPLVELLADPAPFRALFAEVRDLVRTEGVGPAMLRFSEGLGAQRPPERTFELPAAVVETAARMHANQPVFLEHVLVPFTATVPDVNALHAAAHKLVPAAGRESRDQVPLHGPAARLADLLGRPLTAFPGGHLAAVERPQEFAASLLKALESA